MRLEQRDQAMRVLRDGLVRNRAHSGAAATLIRLLLEDGRPDAAREVWSDVSARAGPNAALYDAGLSLARATSDRRLGERLARDSAMLFPDSIELLAERVAFYRTNDRPDEALHALIASCRYLDHDGAADRQRLLRRVIRDTMVFMSNRGDPEVVDWMPRVLERCPSQIAWDLRSSPALWIGLSMRRPSSPGEGLELARSLIASGRGGLAERTLAYVDRTGKPPEAAEGQELLGDLLLRRDAYERAGDAYLRAYKLAALPKVRMEGLAVKAALAYYRAKSDRIMDVFELAGPRMMRFAELPGGMKLRPNAPTPAPDQRILYDPPWETAQARGLVWLLRGFSTGMRDLALSGYAAALFAEPAFKLGQNSGAWSYQILDELTNVIEAWPKMKTPVPRLPDGCLDHFASLYLREQEIFEPDETASTEDWAGMFEQGNRARLIAKRLNVTSGKFFFVRVRGGIAYGTTVPGHAEDLYTGRGWVPYASWKAGQRSAHKYAEPGVYLMKLTEPQLEAERIFREGVQIAYRTYDLKRGLQEIERAIARDDTNVEALRVAAHVSALLGRTERCAAFAERGVMLDPDARGAEILARACRAAM